MDHQNQILDFLQKPENLPVALEVATHVEALRLRLHKTFWQDITQALKTRIEISSYSDRWIIFSEGQYDNAWKNIQVQIKSKPEGFTGSILVVALMQNRPNSKYQLNYGLLWTPKDRQPPDLESYKALMVYSKQAGFIDKEQNSWWPVNHYLDIYLRSDEFMLSYGLQSDEFIDGLAEKVWDYFTGLEPSLFQLNQELFQAG